MLAAVADPDLDVHGVVGDHPGEGAGRPHLADPVAGTLLRLAVAVADLDALIGIDVDHPAGIAAVPRHPLGAPVGSLIGAFGIGRAGEKHGRGDQQYPHGNHSCAAAAAGRRATILISVMPRSGISRSTSIAVQAGKGAVT